MLMIRPSDFQNPNPGPHALELQTNIEKCKNQYLRFLQKRQTFRNDITLVNVYVDLLVFTCIAGTS